MSTAQIRVTLDEQRTARLDALRGVASRTAFADYLLSWAIDVGGPAAVADHLHRAVGEAGQ